MRLSPLVVAVRLGLGLGLGLELTAPRVAHAEAALVVGAAVGAGDTAVAVFADVPAVVAAIDRCRDATPVKVAIPALAVFWLRAGAGHAVAEAHVSGGEVPPSKLDACMAHVLATARLSKPIAAGAVVAGHVALYAATAAVPDTAGGEDIRRFDSPRAWTAQPTRVDALGRPAVDELDDLEAARAGLDACVAKRTERQPRRDLLAWLERTADGHVRVAVAAGAGEAPLERCLGTALGRTLGTSKLAGAAWIRMRAISATDASAGSPPPAGVQTLNLGSARP